MAANKRARVRCRACVGERFADSVAKSAKYISDEEFAKVVTMCDTAAPAVAFKGGIDQVKRVIDNARILRTKKTVADLEAKLLKAVSAQNEAQEGQKPLEDVHNAIRKMYKAVLSHEKKIAADLALTQEVIQKTKGMKDNMILELLVRPYTTHSVVYGTVQRGAAK
jgi:hypothetical protein